MNIKILAKGAANLFVKRFAGPFWFRRRQLVKTQWWSEQELKALQLKLLKRIVKHAYDTVPYYRKLMDERGISVESINTLEDIKQFPILTRQDVLKAGDSIVSTKYPSWLLRMAHTSGTTGTPMVIRRDLFSIENEHAFVRRQWDWAGLGFNDRCAYLKGRVIVRPGSKSSRLYVYDPMMKELHLSTYHLSTETARHYIDVMKRYKVKALFGYPSAVYPVARACLDYGINFKLRSVLLTSETLFPAYRQVIAEAFDCKVFDFYGGAERVCYIFTCEHGNYHIIPEYGLTELIPVDKSDGNEFKIVATGFWNMAMPLIRYDTGDFVVPSDEKCLCGRAFPVIKSIKGRECDVVRTPSGTVLGASILTALVYVVCRAEHFVESQIIQDALGHITLEYVPTKNCSGRYLSELENCISKHLPADLKLSLREVKMVKRTQSGKLRAVVSEIR
jgi:phenylacetate-CoA ligase